MVANINRRTRIIFMDEGVRVETAICQLSQEDLEQLLIVATGEAEAGLTRVIPTFDELPPTVQQNHRNAAERDLFESRS